jgi:hypothetical protein
MLNTMRVGAVALTFALAATAVAYKGQPGPGGFRVNEVPPVLEKLIEKK